MARYVKTSLPKLIQKEHKIMKWQF